MRDVLSIQSHVAYGHVGNDAATFTMQRLGVEVWPIHTVQFSNHTGYGAWTGRIFDGPMIEELLDGIEARGVLGRCDGVLSGYMGSADVGTAILAAVARVRAANPDARYCCDPVIGDVGRGVYVRPGLEEFMRDHAVPSADVVTPNHFELDLLARTTTRTLDEVVAAIDLVRALGPSQVLVTSVRTADTPRDAVDLVLGEAGRTWRVRTPRLELDAVSGAGDMIAAQLLVHLLDGADGGAALEAAAAGTWGVLEATAAAGADELQLVAAQAELAAPSRRFAVEEL